ncbi:MAG TPA: (2Fe-2S)-binding protein [Anaerolineae bacterium]|nr:(2Fe-2S)-binding protein [Anaerolineae bacterium]
MKEILELKINGEIHSLAVEPNVTLQEVLREQLGLTGTKQGCDTGECGACTVLIDGMAVNSCLVLAVDAGGKEITTIEGLAQNGNLHPLQVAFHEWGAIQCGYCSPGMILSAKALLDRNPNPSRREIQEAIAGNLCRCTGYVKIIEAIQAAAATMREGAREG